MQFYTRLSIYGIALLDEMAFFEHRSEIRFFSYILQCRIYTIEEKQDNTNAKRYQTQQSLIQPCLILLNFNKDLIHDYKNLINQLFFSFIFIID